MNDDLNDLDGLLEKINDTRVRGVDPRDFANLVRMVRHMRRLIGELMEDR